MYMFYLLPLLECDVNEVIAYVGFEYIFFTLDRALGIYPWPCTYQSYDLSSCCTNSIPSMGTPQFLYPSANWWTAVDVWLFQVFDDEEWTFSYGFSCGQMWSLGKYLRVGSLGPYGKHIFHFTRIRQTVSQSGWTVWHSQGPQSVWVLWWPHLHS